MKYLYLITILILMLTLAGCTDQDKKIYEKSSQPTSEPLTPLEEFEKGKPSEEILNELNAIYYEPNLNQEIDFELGKITISLPENDVNGNIFIPNLKYFEGVCSENKEFNNSEKINIRPGYVGNKWCISNGQEKVNLYLNSLYVPSRNQCKGDCQENEQKTSFYIVQS